MGVVVPPVVPPLLKPGLVVRPCKPHMPVELVLLTPLGQPPSRIAHAFMAQLRLGCAELPQSWG